MCRALKVLCVATDAGSLAALKRAVVSAEWELAPGAADEEAAFAPYERLVALTRERFPAMRIVADRDLPGATVVAASVEEARGLLKELPRPGGPVRSV